MSEWRSALTSDEESTIAVIEAAISRSKASVRLLQKDRRAILNRAFQRNRRHTQKSVDTEVEHT